MICFLALVVFGLLGFFSVKHRKIAFEAFDCVFRRITVRKCTSALDKRLKSMITGRLMGKSPALAGFVFKYFEVLSWVFTVLFFASTIFSGMSIYNYLAYGDCNGNNPNSGNSCIYSEAEGFFSNFFQYFSEKQKCGISSCQNNNCTCKSLEGCIGSEKNKCDEICYNKGEK